jgi:hypothetical protein
MLPRADRGPRNLDGSTGPVLGRSRFASFHLGHAVGACRRGQACYQQCVARRSDRCWVASGPGAATQDSTTSGRRLGEGGQLPRAFHRWVHRNVAVTEADSASTWATTYCNGSSELGEWRFVTCLLPSTWALTDGPSHDQPMPASAERIFLLRGRWTPAKTAEVRRGWSARWGTQAGGGTGTVTRARSGSGNGLVVFEVRSDLVAVQAAGGLATSGGSLVGGTARVVESLR